MSRLRAAWAAADPDLRVMIVTSVIALIWCVVLLDPLGPATIDPDASSSVLYFQRIVSGQRLEAFVPTTPKPFLTFEYGLTWALIGDWRELVALTILVFAVAVGGMAAFVYRLTWWATSPTAMLGGAGGDSRAIVGPAGRTIAALAAAAFLTAALLGSSDLMLEVSRANSLIWALGWWALAGLAVTSVPARPRLAGAALLVAGLCRFETFALTAVAIAVAAILVVRDRRAQRMPTMPPAIAETAEHYEARRRTVDHTAARGAVVGAALALLALPIALLHDWLLTGDPLYWLSVPARYTAVFNPGLELIGPLDYAGIVAGRLAPEWLLIVLAAVGVVALARSRQWLSLAGIAALGLGVVALLFWLALRATYISNRYYEPIDLALATAAAVGVGLLVAEAVRRLRLSDRVAAPAAAAAVTAVAAIAGLAAVWPALPFDRRATTELADVRTASAHLATVMPTLAPIAATPQDSPGYPLVSLNDPDPPILYVPSRDVARVVVESGSDLERVGNLYAVLLNDGMSAFVAGQVLFHDAAADRPAALFKPLEIDDRATVGPVELVRIDPRLPGIWILSVQ